MADSALAPIQSSDLNKKYLRLEHRRLVITTQIFMLLRSTFSTGVSVLFLLWPMPRFPFEYCSAYSPISARKLRTVWRFDSPGKWWIVMEIESGTDKMLRSYRIELIFTDFDITSTYDDMNKKRMTKDRVPYPTYGSRIIEEINKRWNNQILTWFFFFDESNNHRRDIG